MEKDSNLPSSSLRFYSIGIVAVTKDPGSDVAKIWLTEVHPFENGDISKLYKKIDVTTVNLKGVKEKAEFEGRAYIEASWLPLSNSNRISSPDVVANETVIVLMFADDQKYYWTTMFREPILRRLENVLYGFSNLATGIGKKAFDRLSSYWFEVSTRNKHITLQTSKSDGEPFSYTIKIDTRRGIVDIKDDVGNSWQLNSASGEIKNKANKQIVNEAPLIINRCNLLVNETPQVRNTGDTFTEGKSIANPHIG